MSNGDFYQAQADLFAAALAQDLESGEVGTPELIAERANVLASFAYEDTPEVKASYQAHESSMMAASPEISEAITESRVMTMGVPLAANIAGWIGSTLASKILGLGEGSVLKQAISTGIASTVAGQPSSYGAMEGVEMSNGITVVDGIAVSGPGVPEPPKAMVARQWVVKVNADRWAGRGETFYMYFFRLIDGRIMSYHPYKGWKIWRPKKPLAVMYRGKTSLSQAVKVQKYLDTMWKTVAKKTKALKMAK